MPSTNPPDDLSPWPWQAGVERVTEAKSLARFTAWLTALNLLAAAVAGTGLLFQAGLDPTLAVAATALLLVLASLPTAMLHSRLWHHASSDPGGKRDSAPVLLDIPLLNVLWLPLGLPLLALSLRRSLARAGLRAWSATLALCLSPLLGLAPFLALAALLLEPPLLQTALLALLATLALLLTLYFGLLAHAAISRLAAGQGFVARDPHRARAWSLALGLTAAVLAMGLLLRLHALNRDTGNWGLLARAHLETTMAACDIAATFDLLEHRDFHCEHALDYLNPPGSGLSLVITDQGETPVRACLLSVSHPGLAEPLTAQWIMPDPEIPPDLDQDLDLDQP